MDLKLEKMVCQLLYNERKIERWKIANCLLHAGRRFILIMIIMKLIITLVDSLVA